MTFGALVAAFHSTRQSPPWRARKCRHGCDGIDIDGGSPIRSPASEREPVRRNGLPPPPRGGTPTVRDAWNTTRRETRHEMGRGRGSRFQRAHERADGGGRGIRTPGAREGTAVFKTAAIGRSAIPPGLGACRLAAASCPCQGAIRRMLARLPWRNSAESSPTRPRRARRAAATRRRATRTRRARRTSARRSGPPARLRRMAGSRPPSRLPSGPSCRRRQAPAPTARRTCCRAVR